MTKLVYLLYNLVLIVVSLFYLPVLIYKVIFGEEEWRGVKERFGWLPESIKATFENRPTIWIHGASVGETGAASPLVTELKEKFPHHQILFSTMTSTGQEMAQNVISEADGFIYLPLDLAGVVKRVLNQINPDLIVILETELWPNFINQAHKKGTKLMIASGRISDKSINQYHYLGPILDDMLANVDYFSMQSELDRERIIELGAPEDKVYNNGNTKFDQDYGSTSQAAKDELYQKYKLDPQQPIIVLGSTHQDEEEQLLPLYTKLKERFPDLVLIVAPRYVERVDQLEELYEEAGIKTAKRTEIAARNPADESVIIVDIIGELAQIYGIADLVFVGGSLIERGGHNVLEPAAQGRLVFFGPHMFNFKDSTELLLKHEVGIQVDNVDQLESQMSSYLQQPAKLEAKNKAALNLISKNQGAARANADLAANLLEQQHILCLRLSAIGDLIHALPVAKAMRDSYPEAEISWIVERKAYDLVENNPYLDNVILLPKESWREDFKDEKRQTFQQAKQFFADLKEEHDFDLALDVHGLFKSGLTAFLSGASRRVGPADGREGSKLFYNQQVELPEEELHQIDRNLHLAQAVGATSEELSYGLISSEATKKQVEQLLAAESVNRSKQLIAINPFTSWESKDWSRERYVQLADKLVAEFNCEILFTGGPGDRDKVREMIELMDQVAHNLAGETDLKELAELYTRVDLFIGGDTGPMHLAVAQDTKAIVLMGPTNPATHGPYGKQHVVIQPDIDCKNCWNRVCPRDDHLCMEQISVGKVLKAIENVKLRMEN
jgi:3-deoxy-D-manno-octulosonic-acid transferase